MTRKRVQWKFRDSSLTIGERTLIVGILNLTPDSFSDGGNYSDPNAAVKRALQLQEQGADILDIGAESTRPGSEPVSDAEELRRLIPVLKRLKGKIEIPISVDTYKPAVAEAALEHGASIVNDVSGLVWEPELAKTVLHAGAGLILSHTRGKPEEWARLAPMRDVMGEIASELEASVHRARRAGIELDHIVIDPGVGFGKRKEQNSELLARLGELRRLLLPIMVGPSRKSFLAQEDSRLLEFATAGAVATAILNGASLVRVHDVAAMRAVVNTVDAIVAAIPEVEQEEKPRRPAREAVRERDQEEARKKKPVRPPLIGGPKKETAPPPVEDDRRPPFRGGDRPAYGGRREDREQERPSYRGRREDEGDRRPPYRGRGEEGRGERRPPYSGRGDERSERRTPFRGRSDEGGGERRPPYRGKREEGGERRPPFRGRGDEGGGERRPPYRGKRDEGGERRPPFRGRGDEGGGERRPTYRGKRDEGGERRPPFRGRGEEGGERRSPPRGKGGDDRRPGGGRPPSRGPGGGGPRGGGRGPSTPRRRG